LPVIVRFVLTIVAQRISLAFGRSHEEQSFSSIVFPRIPVLSAVALPLSTLGVVLGRQIGLGTPLLAALPSRRPGSARQLRGVIGGLSVSLGAAVADEVWFRRGPMTLLIWIVARLLGHRAVRPGVAWTSIVIASVGCGLAHLPQLASPTGGAIGEEAWSPRWSLISRWTWFSTCFPRS
jgi:hypothetical protein